MKRLTSRVSRRHAIRTAGAVIALPALESLGFRRFAAAAAHAVPPKRLVFLGFGWGVTEESWYPDIKTPGADYALPAGLQPLARHKRDFTIVQNLTEVTNDNRRLATAVFECFRSRRSAILVGLSDIFHFHISLFGEACGQSSAAA